MCLASPHCPLAGEEGPAEYVAEAVSLLGVERVDHGVHCLDDPEVRCDALPRSCWRIAGRLARCLRSCARTCQRTWRLGIKAPVLAWHPGPCPSG